MSKYGIGPLEMSRPYQHYIDAITNWQMQKPKCPWEKEEKISFRYRIKCAWRVLKGEMLAFYPYGR